MKERKPPDAIIFINFSSIVEPCGWMEIEGGKVEDLIYLACCAHTYSTTQLALNMIRF